MSQLSIIVAVDPKKCFITTLYIFYFKTFRESFYKCCKKIYKRIKIKQKKSYIIDIGSNDGVALKPFKELGFKKYWIEPAKNLAKIANKNKIKTYNGF